MTLRNSLTFLCLAALFLAALTPLAPILFWAILIPLLFSCPLTELFVRVRENSRDLPKSSLTCLLPSRAPPTVA